MNWASVEEIAKRTRTLMECATTLMTVSGLTTSAECVTDREPFTSVVAKRCQREIVIVRGT